MEPIILDCRKKGCTRLVQWVVFFPNSRNFRRSCASHLGYVVLSVAAGCEQPTAVTLQRISSVGR